jgi:hypothetical protein
LDIKRRSAVFEHITPELSPDSQYLEKKLNAIIAKYYEDTAAIRRHMIECGILGRNRESVY